MATAIHKTGRPGIPPQRHREHRAIPLCSRWLWGEGSGYKILTFWVDQEGSIPLLQLSPTLWKALSGAFLDVVQNGLIGGGIVLLVNDNRGVSINQGEGDPAVGQIAEGGDTVQVDHIDVSVIRDFDPVSHKPSSHAVIQVILPSILFHLYGTSTGGTCLVWASK